MKMTLPWLFFYEWENKSLSVIYALQCPMPITGRLKFTAKPHKSELLD